VLAAAIGAPQADSFRFVLLGDRTGEAQPGVFERVWQEAAAQNPAFFASVGDTIEGLDDATAEKQWQQIGETLKPYRQFPLYLAPGNHDVWSPLSEKLYRQYSLRALHYSFDYGQAHFVILDDSRSDALPPEELQFLESDLAAHAAAPVKFVIFHRPSWILEVALDNPQFPLQQIARKYGVRYVISGHIHQILRGNLEGVTYLSMPSAGGHLRLSGRYEDGWFFGYAVVEVRDKEAVFQFHELKSPYGQGRVTGLADWGKAGLVSK